MRKLAPDGEDLSRRRARLKVWSKALRVHQYAKNALIFVPMIVGHVINPATILQACLAFLAFSAAASAVYLVNDLVDLSDDRLHPTKKCRPFASGELSIPEGLLAVPLLLVFSAAIAAFLPLAFAAVLGAYLVLTTAYSFWLKRKLLVDVVLLALLYSVRVVAGGCATGIALSNWLIGFCVFVFTSFALIKRYTELLVRLDADLPDPRNRGYRKSDLPVIATLAAATGANSVTVLGLYISSPQVVALYRQPQLLWLLCPLIMFLMSRALMIAHRREMHDDPVVWALTDRVCRVAGVLAVGVMAAASIA